MKRTKEKQEIEMENEERQRMFKHEITDAMRKQGSRFTSEPSYVIIEDLVFGRMAFKGMNPEIEKIMENDRIRQEEAENEAKEKEINDQEMAAHYGSLHKTIAKKFAKKRQANEMSSNKSGEEILKEGEQILKKAREGSLMSFPGRKKRAFQKPKD